MSTARALVGRRPSVRGAALRVGAAAGTSARAHERWEPVALVLVVLLLVTFGLVNLYSASAYMARDEGLPGHHYVLRQAGGVLAGVVVSLLLARADYRRLRDLAWPLIGLTLGLLLLTVLPWTHAITPPVNEARRWISFGITLQPSELAKLTLMIWTAALAVKKQERLHSLSKGMLPFLLVWMAVTIPVALQPSLSAAMLIALLAALVLFAGGARIGHVILLAVVAVPLVGMQIRASPYQMQRLTSYMHRGADPATDYQSFQSLIAIGSGGLTGRGLGEGHQKFGFVPEPHNDFIFAMIAEEWGLFGVVFTLALFAVFGLAGYRVASRAPDLFGYLVAIGMTNLVVVSALLHMGIVLDLLPTTGAPLPFVSYGRSGLLACFAAVGVLLSVSRRSGEAGA